MKISFNISDREKLGNLTYDVGYYKFEAFPKERKFGWKMQFVVDAFSNAPVDAFGSHYKPLQIEISHIHKKSPAYY